MALRIYQLLLTFVAVALCADQLSPAEMKKFRDILLKCHNYLRKNHKAGKLTLNSELNNAAQSYAEELVKRGRLEHSSGRNSTGENLYSAGISITTGQDFKSSYKQIATDACQSWYCQESDYRYDDPQYDQSHMKDIENFSQMVWKGTTQVGFGMHFIETPNIMKNRVYVVGRYRASGNVMPVDNFKVNVDTPKRKYPCVREAI